MLQALSRKSASGTVSRLGANSATSRRNIMTAILNIVGPVVIHRTVARNFKFLSMLTAKQFSAAAEDLQKLNLGVLVSVQVKGHSTDYFIKRSPEEVRPILEADPELCLPERFEAQYKRPISKSISLAARAQLAELGLVHESLMK